MNYILLTQKCNNELKNRYLKYINETSSTIKFVEYINELFNPSNRGIIYTKISESPLKIKIWAQDMEMLLEEFPQKSAFKAIAIKSIEIERFNRVLKYADLLEGDWDFDLMSSDVYSEGEFEFVRDKECFNEKKQAFEEYNKYWIDSDIITKKREEKSREDSKQSITNYSNIAINFDKNTIIFKLIDNKYKFKEKQRIRISSHTINEPNIYSTLLAGQVVNYNNTKKELVVESDDIRLLENIFQKKEYKKGCLFVDDIGTLTMLKRQKKALESLFNRDTANENLKDFIPNINEASDIKSDFLNENLLSDGFKDMNQSQKKAIKNAIECKDINLIQGPPGTGKTTVICEIVKYLTKDNKTVLISSQNHLAVDNVLQRVGEEDSVRAIRVGKEENFELGCEKYALSNRVEFLQDEILNNIENINNEYKIQNMYLEENSKLYNSYTTSKEKIKLLLKLIDSYNSHEKNYVSLENQLSDLTIKINKLNNDILSIENIIGDNLEDINYLSDMVNKCELDRSKILKHADEILNLNVNKGDLENLNIYLQMKNSIEILLNDYREIDLNLQKEKSIQENLKTEFEDIKNKIISLKIQKSELSKGVEQYVDEKIEAFKQELLLIKEEYRSKEFDIRGFGNKRSSIYTDICNCKNEIDKYKEKIELMITLNSKYNLNKQEFIYIVIARDYLLKKAEEKGIDINLISHIKDAENIQSLYLEKSKTQNDIQTISEETDKEKKYIEAFTERMDKYISDDDVKSVLENENVSIKSLNPSILINIETYIDNYQDIERKKLLLDKTNDLRLQWKENMSYYQQSFEDVYIGISNVICATCSGIAASDSNSFMEKEFDYVIVDEAAKCFSSEILIPIIKGKKIILVGDHKQLSPIVEKDILEEMEANEDISRDERKNYYNNSLFGIIFEKANKSIKTTLDIQYRMNSDISKFISRQYYKNELKDGPNIINLNHGVSKLNKGLYWIDTINTKNSREDMMGTSYYNVEESKIILNLLNWLDDNLNDKKEIGIISPYSAQKTYLVDLLNQYNFNNIDLEINTVDAFQGREKEIIIMNCVRNNEKGEFGHVSGDSRMNVAISRAQELLFIVGNRQFVESNKKASKSMYSLVNYLDKDNSIINKDFFS